MMKSITQKIGVFVVFMLLVVGGIAYAEENQYFSMSYNVVSTCVPGILGQETANVEVWINTTESISVRNLSFCVYFSENDGVTIDTDAIKAGNCIEEGHFASPTIEDKESSKFLLIECKGGANNVAIKASCESQLLCTVPIKVNVNKAGQNIKLTLDLEAITGEDSAARIVEYETYLGSNPDIPAAIEFQVYKSFSIAKAKDFQTTEDDNAAPKSVQIDANDDTLFACKGWDTAKSDFSAVTSGVSFTSVKWKNENDTVNCTDVYGTLEIADGKISFTPKQYWYGTTDTVVATAKWENSSETADVEFQIVVDPVQTGAVAEWTGLTTTSWQEGDTWANIADAAKKITLTYTSYDNVALSDFESTLFWGDVELGFSTTSSGESKSDSRIKVGDGDGPIQVYSVTNTYTITSWKDNLETIPYEAVAHPSKSRVESLVFNAKATVGDLRYTIENGLGDITVNDTDRAPSSPAITSILPADPTVTDTLELTATVGTDEDGDTTTLVYQWYKGDDMIHDATGASYSLANAKKGESYKCVVKTSTDPYGDGTLVSDAGVTSSAVKVLNSKPVVAESPRNIFVLRGTDTTGTLSILVSDADGIDDVLIMTSMSDTAALSEVTTTQNGKATLSINKEAKTIDIAYTIPESFNGATEDKQDSFSFAIGDNGDDSTSAAYTAIEITVDYKENPVPVIEDLGDAVTIKEVDEDGNPTKFSVHVKATDDQVWPAGVKAWKVEVPEGWKVENENGATGSKQTEGAWSGEFTADITCAGYDTITGASRPSEKNFTVKISAQDVATDAWGTLEKNVTVEDVDRKPTGEVTITLEKDAIVYGDTLKVTQATGAVDADGDEITYTYEWFYCTPDSTTAVATDVTTAEYSSNDVVIKDNVIIVKAKAQTKPYNDSDKLEVTDFLGTKEVTVGNTAPYISVIETASVGDNHSADLTYEAVVGQKDGDEEAERTVTYTVQVVDPDVTAGRDTLAFDVTAWDESNGTISIAADSSDVSKATITVILPKHYNNAGASELPMATITVKDDDTDAQNKGILTLKVTEKNLAPVVAVADQYVLPADLGKDLTAEFSVDMGSKYETSQLLTAATITAVDNEDTSIFDVVPTVTVPTADETSATVKFTYKVKADAAIGKNCKFSIQVTDNGTTDGVTDAKQSEIAYFTIYVGATPWYPIITMECTDKDNHTDGHIVVIADENGIEYEMVIRTVNADGAITVLPKDYAAIGHPGYKTGVKLFATAYNWTVKNGKDSDVEATKDEITVADYTVPSFATTESTETTLTDANEEGVVEIPVISVPMAQKYVIAIEDKDGGNVVLTQEGDFTADETSGMILPNIPAQSIKLAAGTYSFCVKGVNPEGEGDVVELFTLNVTGNADDEVAWTNEGAFSPKNNAIVNASPVKFSWPAATGAESYDLYIFDQNGTCIVRETGLNSLNTTVELEMNDEVATSYSWYVRANGAKDTADTQNFAFTLAKSITDFAITSLSVDADGQLVLNIEGSVNPDDTITVDFQYFSMHTDNRWYNRHGKIATSGDNNTLIIDELKDKDDNAVATVSVGDYIALRYYINGKMVNNYVVYCITTQD